MPTPEFIDLPIKRPLPVNVGLGRGGPGAFAARVVAVAAVATLAVGCGPALAAQPPSQGLGFVAQSAGPGKPSKAADSPALRSAMDAQLFYQVLMAEIQAEQGELATAYALMMDATARLRDEALFRRAFQLALMGRASDEALSSLRRWRTAFPQSAQAMRNQLQLLGALDRRAEAVEPARALLAASAKPSSRAGLLLALPRYFVQPAAPNAPSAPGAGVTPAGVQTVQELVAPYAEQAGLRQASRVALGRAWLAAGQSNKAYGLLREAADLPAAEQGPHAALFALELMATQREAESIVSHYLALPIAQGAAQPEALREHIAVRLAYSQRLIQTQRFGHAIEQLGLVSSLDPKAPEPFLTLGALHLELKEAAQAEQALLRFVALAEQSKSSAGSEADDGDDASSPSPMSASASGQGDDDEDEALSGPSAVRERNFARAFLLLAQATEQQGRIEESKAWLDRVNPSDSHQALELQTRRAGLLARQGQLAQGRALIRALPERGEEEARGKVMAEAGLLRDLKQWQEAYTFLATASQRWPRDSDLLYEQAMMAEKLDRMDELERLLRRVIELKPDNPHAHNALGYSLADRRQRLPEARTLIQRALELAPGDPFITDSLGWVEFRMGNREQALKHLQTAYAARPDAEIATHLGEVLWSLNRKDEALALWRQARERDSSNEVLRETLTRLKVQL